MATYERLDYGSPDGSQWGGASTDLIATHGATPCDQSPTAASVTTTAMVAISSGYGFGTAAQGDAVITAVNAILVCLKEKGLMATA